MSGQHTPEPWAVSAMGGGIYSGDVSICQFFDNAGEDYPNYEANAGRIVSCVNACAGFSDDELYVVATHGGFIDQARYNAKVTAQRDELLAALCRVASVVHCGGLAGLAEGEALAKARAATLPYFGRASSQAAHLAAIASARTQP